MVRTLSWRTLLASPIGVLHQQVYHTCRRRFASASRGAAPRREAREAAPSDVRRRRPAESRHTWRGHRASPGGGANSRPAAAPPGDSAATPGTSPRLLTSPSGAPPLAPRLARTRRHASLGGGASSLLAQRLQHALPGGSAMPFGRRRLLPGWGDALCPAAALPAAARPLAWRLSIPTPTVAL